MHHGISGMLENNNENQDITLEQVNEILSTLGLQIQAAFQAKDYQTAQHVIRQVLEIAPRQKMAWMDLATATLRLSEHEQAYEYFQTCIQHMGDQVDTNVYDGLTETCHELGKTDEYIHYGRLAISTKKNMVKDEPQQTLPSDFPAPYNPHNRKENIISYSLFGDSPRYGETAILNLQLAKDIYPEWTCRFYVDETVPQSVLQRLEQQGAQIIQVNEKQKQISGLYWRFLVMDDPNVARFLIRDADSFLSYRERAAVDEWLSSNYWFHKMHDGYSHTELILAGMWGGCTGVFHHIQAHIEAFIETGRFTNQRVMDQHYLRYCIWPTLQRSVLIHDRYGYNSNALDFPIQQQKTIYEQNQRFHVGENEASSYVKIFIQHAPAKEITWILKDEQEQEICRYDVVVNYALNFSVYLPIQYADRIKNEEWLIVTQPKRES